MVAPMKLRPFATLALLAGSASATTIWTYTGPPMTAVFGNPALKPSGLSDHFVITVTLAGDPRAGVLYTPGTVGGEWDASDGGSPLGISVSWTDGSVGFRFAGGELSGNNHIRDNVRNGLGLFGTSFPVWVGFGDGQGPDSLLVCNGNPTVQCDGPTYREQAGGKGTWTVAQVPEPHNIILAGSALFGLWALPRGRQSDRPPRIVAELIRRFR
jgi:hypothetical protein